MRKALLFAITALTLGCSTSPGPSGWVHSETATGPFVLSLDLPTDTWGAGQPITG